FGVVYRARDTELGRLVALKVPRQGRLATARELDRFLREARNAAQLHHPNIVGLYETVREGEACYLVSEFLTGKTRAERVPPGRPDFRDRAELLPHVAGAVLYALQQGVIHRALKPANVLLAVSPPPTPGERETASPMVPKILDFGLAKRDAAD